MISELYFGEEDTLRGQSKAADRNEHYYSPGASSSKLGVFRNDEPKSSASQAGWFLQLPSGCLLQGQSAGPGGLSCLLKYLVNSEQNTRQEKGIFLELWEQYVFLERKLFVKKRIERTQQRNTRVRQSSFSPSQTYCLWICALEYISLKFDVAKAISVPSPLSLSPAASYYDHLVFSA